MANLLVLNLLELRLVVALRSVYGSTLGTGPALEQVLTL